MSAQGKIKSAVQEYLQSGDVKKLREAIKIHPDVISTECGEYPDVHRLVDLQIDGQFFRVCRQISREESILLVPIDELFEVPGVPLWLEGEKLKAWARNEEENPSDEPTDWEQYR